MAPLYINLIGSTAFFAVLLYIAAKRARRHDESVYAMDGSRTSLPSVTQRSVMNSSSSPAWAYSSHGPLHMDGQYGSGEHNVKKY